MQKRRNSEFRTSRIYSDPSFGRPARFGSLPNSRSTTPRGHYVISIRFRPLSQGVDLGPSLGALSSLSWNSLGSLGRALPSLGTLWQGLWSFESDLKLRRDRIQSVGSSTLGHSQGATILIWEGLWRPYPNMGSTRSNKELMLISIQGSVDKQSPIRH